MQVPISDYRASDSTAKGIQQPQPQFDNKPDISTNLEVPSIADVEMIALSADLFSYLENASAVAGGSSLGVEGNDVENLGSASLKPAARPASSGPLRHRRGHQDRQLSINSYASTTSNSDPNRQGPASGDSNEVTTTASSDQRTVKVGDYAFTIPLSSPIIPPQLQANMRITSTGRPSHARKVPEDHVKVSIRPRAR